VTLTADIVAAPCFVLRTPLLPLDEWLALANDVAAPRAPGRELTGALASDRDLVRQRLRALVGRPEVREALFVASPSLDEALAIWLRNPDSERGLKAERSLVRYIARMCGRATPFGLFAGCAVGSVDLAGLTSLEVASRQRHRRHTRLDMDYLSALCETLAADPQVRERLRYRPSSSLYIAGGRIRYVEARRANRARSYHLVAVEPSEHLERALDLARAGATLAELRRTVAAAAEVGDEEAREFVDELVATQLLVPDLAPPVTGPEPIHEILRQLDGHDAADRLAGAQRALHDIDGAPLGVEVASYRAIADSLRPLPVEIELSRLFQADLFTAVDEARLGGAVVSELTRGVRLLHRLARPRDPLRAFREAFVARYDRAMVPLVEVLDEELGIGLDATTRAGADASPLIDALPFGGAPARERQVPWSEREQRLLDKMTAAAARGERAIELDDTDVEAMATSSPAPLADSFAVVATVLGDSDGHHDFRIQLVSVGGPSSATLLGRFCHGDARLADFVREELRIEEAARPDAMFAEIVHLPEGRVGNVLLRPLLRRWELPFLGASGAPADAQLPITDLLVMVEGEKVILRSRRLGCEIVPRLSSAHNYTQPSSLSLYRFLCSLQAQGVAGGLGWDWGPFAGAAFLPRVVCGRIILARSRWRLRRAQLEPLVDATDDERWRHVQALRRELALPRFVFLEDGDNLLPIDLDEVLSVESLAHLIKRRAEAVLVESLAGPDEAIVRGGDGTYAHELIVPYRRLRSSQPIATAPIRARAAPVRSAPGASDRNVPPGGDCLYVKLYSGAATADRVLRDAFAPLVAAARASGAVHNWFFVRYGDPDWHLRLRLFGDAERLRAEVFGPLTRAAIAAVRAGQGWRLQLDTYEREVERYGGSVGLSLCEELFGFDSDAALAIVARLDGDSGADARWRLALLGIDRMLDDLGLALDEKLRLVGDLRGSLARELDVGPSLEKAIGERFRQERVALETLLALPLDRSHPLAPGGAIFDERSRRQATASSALRAAIADGTVSLPLSALAASLVHMHANRLLRASARQHELVLYDFLQRLYLGQRARGKTRRRAMQNESRNEF
jgi:thiopeptide-type bacteriocin biosynthesis protein